MKTITQLLRELKSVELSEGILESVENIERNHLERAYYQNNGQLTFDQWYRATFDK